MCYYAGTTLFKIRWPLYQPTMFQEFKVQTEDPEEGLSDFNYLAPKLFEKQDSFCKRKANFRG